MNLHNLTCTLLLYHKRHSYSYSYLDLFQSGEIGHSEPLQWEKIGKVANWVKLAVPSHSEPLQWEKIGKVANRTKLAVPSHSEPLCIW